MHSIAPVLHWKQRRRSGIVMSHLQMEILQFLDESKRSGFEFVKLPKIHIKTLNAMIDADWLPAPAMTASATRSPRAV